MSFNPDQGLIFINNENWPNLYGKIGGGYKFFNSKLTKILEKIISSREKVKNQVKCNFLIQLAINQLTVKMHYIIPFSFNSTSRIQVTHFKKYKCGDPQNPALYNNCFELPSDWLFQQLNSQSEGSSKQLLYKAGLWGSQHLYYLNFFTCTCCRQ